MKVLVTGASGFIGQHLVKRLVRDGHKVYSLVRQTSRTEALKKLDTELVYAELQDKASLEAVVRQHPDIDTVFHVAGVITPISKGDDIYWESNYLGTQHMLDACRNLSLKAFIYSSSVGVFGLLPQIPANEQSRCQPDNAYSETKYKAELLVREYVQSFQLPAVTVRLAWCYGPGDRRTYKFFRMVAKGKFFLIGNGQTKLHPIHIDDVVQALVLCAGQIEKTKGEIFIAAGPETVTLQSLAATIAREAKSSILPVKVPAWIAKTGATLCETVCKPLGIEPPIHHRRLDFFFRDQAFDISKNRKLGFEPQVDVATGVRQTVKWYAEQGWFA